MLGSRIKFNNFLSNKKLFKIYFFVLYNYEPQDNISEVQTFDAPR